MRLIGRPDQGSIQRIAIETPIQGDAKRARFKDSDAGSSLT
jgi:hypothetical protein